MASPSPPSSWVILESVARVCDTDGASATGAGLSFALSTPPRVSHLTIPAHFFPNGTAPSELPHLAVEPSAGLVLLHRNPRRAGFVTDRQLAPGYVVFDAGSGSAQALPEPPLVVNPANIGIVASPDGAGHYVVAELQPLDGTYGASQILVFASYIGKWVSKPVHYPLRPPPRPVHTDGVITFNGKFWWIDLSLGLITCDPFADEPILSFVPLPPGKALEQGQSAVVLDKYRAIRLSAGKLRLIDVYKNRSSNGGFKVGVWTLVDPDSAEWTLEHEASFVDIWADQSYTAVGLPRCIPELALINPKDPAVVYFSLQEHVFGVDLRAGNVVACEVYQLPAPPGDVVSTRCVLAWELPLSMCSGFSGSASASPSWAILATIPLFHSDQSVDLGLVFTSPPGISFATVPRRICPDDITMKNFPSVLAVDSSGLLLLHSTQGTRSCRTKIGDRGFSWSTFANGYFVCHAASSTVFPLPQPEGNRILDAGNVGLINVSGTGTGVSLYIVAELQPIIGSDHATLMCYSSETGRWVNKDLSYPMGRRPRPWGSHSVLSYSGQLWWIDISWGILTCNPTHEMPELKFVPLPPGKRLPFNCTHGRDLEKYRCIKVSQGKIRYVEIVKAYKPRIKVHRLTNLVKPRGKDSWICLWTLSMEDGEWTLDHEVPLSEIWADQTYQATRLTDREPILAVLDPNDYSLVYFFLGKYMFGVDLRSRRLKKCIAHKLAYPPVKYLSSRFLHAWEMPV